MAINIFGGRPTACVAKVTATFASMGLDNTNTAIVYEVGSPLRSWKPDRVINGITGIVAGKGYYFVAIDDMDLETYFAAPIGDEITSELLALIEQLVPLEAPANAPSIEIPAGTLVTGFLVKAPTAVVINIGTTLGGSELVEPTEVDGWAVLRIDTYFEAATIVYFTGFMGDTIFTILK
jgi:hypothetical protein